MNTSWENTRKALQNFTDVLRCYKCGNKPINATRYTICGHFFCKPCTSYDSICVICKTPVLPLEICSDHLIKSLVSYCDTLGEIIQEKDLWNKSNNSNTIQSLDCSTKYRLPKGNINKPNRKGETRLHEACLKNQEDKVKALLAAGANPNTKDNTGWTPLQEVVDFGYTNICKLLLKCGASPNTPGEGNRTALHNAVEQNRLEEAKMLLEYSASKNVYDDHGKRPIDYCKPHTEMWSILTGKDKMLKEPADLNHTLNETLSTMQSFDKIVVYASNLQEGNKRYLDQMVVKHKIKIVSTFLASVTHVIVEANSENVVELSYDVMIALLHGCWILNTEWIQLGMDMSEVLKGDLKIFEVSGTPVKGIPQKARESAQNQNPRLFNQCHFYFAMQSKDVYSINNTQLTKDALMVLVREGGGTVLKREPKSEDFRDKEQFIPFHVANKLSHPLYKCTHYIIYSPGRDEPRVKYNMPHLKTLPLIWLIECIEKFTLIDPSQLGL